MRSLFDDNKIPDDYYRILKSATKYAVWPIDDLLARHKLPVTRKGIQKLNKKAVVLSREEFKSVVKECVTHPWKESGLGIAQGLPVSGVLANIYMLEFDAKIEEIAKNVSGLYMRYSDDFIVAAPSGIKGQERARMAIADIEVSDPQGPLSALSDVNIKKYYAKWLARKSAGRYVPIQLESCVAVIVLLLFPTIFNWLTSPLLSKTFLGDSLYLIILSLCYLSVFLPFLLLMTNSANIPEMRSKWKAIGVRREMKKALKKPEDPDWSYVVGPLARKTVRALVESSDRWCLVRADSERGVLGVRLTGSVEGADLPDAEEGVLYLVYSDYGLNSAKKVQELLGRGYRAYNIGVVFDEQVLWQRLAIELDLLEQSGLVPPRVGGARP